MAKAVPIWVLISGLIGLKLLLAMMVSPSSAAKLKTRPPDIKQLNEAVWELRNPQGAPEMDVIFFHGLQLSEADLDNADWKTWLSRDGTTVWPKDWLGAQFPNARIWSISYSAIALRYSNEMRLKQIIENLVHDIVIDKHYGAGQNRSVILMGHSLGGIIIKRFLLECIWENALRHSDRITEFLENCKGLFFYSTPFGGSQLGDWLDLLPSKNQPIVKLLKLVSSDSAEINSDFRKSKMGTTKSYHIFEGLKTRYKGFSKKVVEEGSARRDVDNFYTVKADHIDVCKPVNHDLDAIYTKLVVFIQQVVMEGNVTKKQLRLPNKPEELESNIISNYYIVQVLKVLSEIGKISRNLAVDIFVHIRAAIIHIICAIWEVALSIWEFARAIWYTIPFFIFFLSLVVVNEGLRHINI